MVAVDCFPTDTTSVADLVLPAASFLEFDDLTFSYFHLLLGAQTKGCEPAGEALPNQEIFRRLAKSMGLTEPALFEDDPSLLARMLREMNMGLDYAQLQRQGHVSLGDEPRMFFADGQFPTPSGRIEIASAAAERMGLPRAPHPWVDASPPAGQVRLLTPASKWRMNDSYANDPHLAERAGPGSVWLAAADAARLGIVEHSAVRLSNAAGAITLTARIDTTLKAGTAVSHKGRWPMLEPQGVNVNCLFDAQMADMGESTAVHSVIVELSAA